MSNTQRIIWIIRCQVQKSNERQPYPWYWLFPSSIHTLAFVLTILSEENAWNLRQAAASKVEWITRRIYYIFLRLWFVISKYFLWFFRRQNVGADASTCSRLKKIPSSRNFGKMLTCSVQLELRTMIKIRHKHQNARVNFPQIFFLWFDC